MRLPTGSLYIPLRGVNAGGAVGSGSRIIGVPWSMLAGTPANDTGKANNINNSAISDILKAMIFSFRANVFSFFFIVYPIHPIYTYYIARLNI
jgi:hypothetical protein